MSPPALVVCGTMVTPGTFLLSGFAVERAATGPGERGKACGGGKPTHQGLWLFLLCPDATSHVEPHILHNQKGPENKGPDEEMLLIL